MDVITHLASSPQGGREPLGTPPRADEERAEQSVWEARSRATLAAVRWAVRSLPRHSEDVLSAMAQQPPFFELLQLSAFARTHEALVHVVDLADELLDSPEARERAVARVRAGQCVRCGYEPKGT